MSYREMLLNNLQDFRDDNQKIAIYSKDNNITYNQLSYEVLNLSQKIIEKYGSDNQVFAIRMGDALNSFKMILALIFSNKTILPIPLEIPEDKANIIINDIKPAVIFLDDRKTYENSIAFSEFDKESAQNNFCPINYSDDSNFIIIMTSGTTGNPKGCCLTDNAFLGRVNALYKKFGFDESDNFLFSSNYSFDVSYTQILTWLFGKGSITIQKKGDDFRSIPDYVNSFRVTHVAISPAVLKYIYTSLRDKTDSIKDIFVAGEKFPRIVAEKYIEQRPYFNLWNMYGPTEFSIYSTYFNISDFKKSDSGVPLGYALEGVTIKLINQEDCLIKEDGIEGEILLGGKGRFSEYINNKEKTLNSLIEIDGQVYYKTGDMGTFIGDKLYFNGRKDHQLKINGIRVESEEIERLIIDKCPEIENVIVKVLVHESKSQLVAFVVLKNKSKHIDLSYIKKNIKKYIEVYFIPKILFVLDEIPLNKNGKIDNNKLKDIYSQSKIKNVSDDTKIMDMDIKNAMQRIWQSILNVYVDDEQANIFNLGADSIDVIVLLTKIEEYFNVELTVEDIYRNPSLTDMITLILLKINSNKIFEINEQLEQNNFKGYLREVDTDSGDKIILYSDTDSKSIMKLINDSYGIEFVPNIVCSNAKNSLEISKYNMSSSKLSETERQKLKKEIICQIEINAKNIYHNISYQNSNLYECGPGQNKIFRKKYNDLVVNRTRIETLDGKRLINALNQVLRKHSMLRSVIQNVDGKYFFKELNSTNKFGIEILDLNWCNNIKVGCDYIVEELFNYVGLMDKKDNLLYRWLLIKIDEKTYELVTIFSHLIADAASSNIFSKEVIFNYQNISEKSEVKKISEFKYNNYLIELNENYSSKKYLEFINSKKFKEIIKLSTNRNKIRNLQTNIVKVPINLLESFTGSQINYSKEGILLWLSAKMASIVLNKEKITFRITNNGRTIGNKRFNQVIGDCHVHFPLVIDSKSDDFYICSKKLIDEYNYYYLENKLYLEDLCYSQNSVENNEIEQMYDNLDFVFNYIGEMDERTSEDYCKSVKKDDTLYKTFYIYCYATKDNYVLNCRLPISCKDIILEKFYSLMKGERA
ncbi:MAG: AMP-binding protein [Clostridiaceae bacterium]